MIYWTNDSVLKNISVLKEDFFNSKTHEKLSKGRKEWCFLKAFERGKF